jgi:hypothetical protein
MAFLKALTLLVGMSDKAMEEKLAWVISAFDEYEPSW